MKATHYENNYGYDVIDVIYALEITDFNVGNALKYIVRAGKKKTEQASRELDLNKAWDYLTRIENKETSEKIKLKDFSQIAAELADGDEDKQLAIRYLLLYSSTGDDVWRRRAVESINKLEW